MFGPNTHLKRQVEVCWHHRSRESRALYQRLQVELERLTGLKDYAFCLIPGSGTTGVESVIMSSNNFIEVLGHNGRFTDRWRNLASYYNMLFGRSPIEQKLTFGCTFETSINQYNPEPFMIQDAVCSFPYFELTGAPAAFICSSNKMLGAIAGVSIVGVRLDSLDLFTGATGSTQALSHFIEARERHETPYTSPTAVMQDLLASIEDLDPVDLRKSIDRRADGLLSVLPTGAFIGDTKGPVLSIHREYLSEHIINKWSLYEKQYPYNCVQIFLYSCSDEQYERFRGDLKDSKNILPK